jgi:hypothetical protein
MKSPLQSFCVGSADDEDQRKSKELERGFCVYRGVQWPPMETQKQTTAAMSNLGCAGL